MSLEPLADYLEPRFGNLYDYNFVVDHDNFEMQLWTDELQLTTSDTIMSAPSGAYRASGAGPSHRIG